MKFPVLSTASLALSAWFLSPAIGQEPAAEAYVDFWKPLVGQWKSTIRIEGSTVEGTYTYTPSPTGRCYVAVSQRADSPTVQSLDGYDPERKGWKGAGFDSDGAFIEGFVAVENLRELKRLRSGAKGTFEERSVGKDGTVKTTKGDWTWTRFDKDGGTLFITNHTEDGEKRPGMTYTLQRAEPDKKSTAAIPEKALKELSFMVGNWETTSTKNGVQAGTATHQRKWAPGGHCLVMNWKGEMDGAVQVATGVSGWDARTGQLIEHWYGNDGAHIIVRYPIDKMTAQAWEGTHSWINPDGSELSGTCRLEKGKDQWRFTSQWEVDGKIQKVENLTRKVK